MSFDRVEGGIVFAWPKVVPVTARMTPAQAWRAWLAEEIDAEEFGRVIAAWS